jgi:hypothetical protein
VLAAQRGAARTAPPDTPTSRFLSKLLRTFADGAGAGAGAGAGGGDSESDDGDDDDAVPLPRPAMLHA